METTNLSKIRRDKMLNTINEIKKGITDEQTLTNLSMIENELTKKKYGLIWEEHEERVDKELETQIPTFEDVKEKEIPEYETYYDVDGNTFTITNHHELGKGGDTPEELPPQTGLNRNNNYDIVFIILSMLSLSFTIKMVKEN